MLLNEGIFYSHVYSYRENPEHEIELTKQGLL